MTFRRQRREDLKSKIVRVPDGHLEGVPFETKEGYRCDVFLGIPYGKAPIENLRFQKPQAPEPWHNIRKCDKLPNRSIFKEMFWEKVLSIAPQSEDCLYLNIFAPQIEEGKKYAVLFYIHCGGFMIDSAERYTLPTLCRRLVSRDVIVVTCHYRLGYLGFLSTADDVCPGNWGLWDQLAALKWTHQNIANFGGDPDNITISGHSAGAASADLISYSPLATGLFKQKIIMGGNSHCHWAVQKPAAVREYCRKHAMKLGWRAKSSYSSQREESLDLLAFFQRMPAAKLGTTMFFSKTIPGECRLPLAPVIDGDFFPSSLQHLRDVQPHVPSIVGGGEYEALLFVAIYLLKGTQKEIESVVKMLAKKRKIPKSVVQEIIDHVYGEPPRTTKQRQHFYVDLISDIFGNWANYRFIKDQQSRGVECYAYSFDWQSKQLWGWLQHVVPFTGGTHTSDLTHLFDCNYMSAALNMNKTDKYVRNLTGKYFTNFIKFGTPNTSETQQVWEPVSKSDTLPRVLSIKPQPEMKTTAYSERMQKLENFLNPANRHITTVSVNE